MPAPNEATPISIKCKICGGDLVNDYIAGSCRCENCGNRWSLSDLIPNFKDYSRIIEKINKAREMLSDTEDAAVAGQALILYKSAEADCLNISDAISADLLRLCNEGQKQADISRHYALGKSYFEKKNYRKARSEFEKVKDVKDSAILMEKCNEEIAIARKKRIPYAVIVGMILPAILSLFLHEKIGLPVLPSVLIFIAGTALLGFAIWFEGVISIIIEILSYLTAIPLAIYMVLAYVFHFNAGTAAKIAIGVPLAIIVVIAVLAERKQ